MRSGCLFYGVHNGVTLRLFQVGRITVTPSREYPPWLWKPPTSPTVPPMTQARCSSALGSSRSSVQDPAVCHSLPARGDNPSSRSRDGSGRGTVVYVASELLVASGFLAGEAAMLRTNPRASIGHLCCQHLLSTNSVYPDLFCRLAGTTSSKFDVWEGASSSRLR